MNQRQNGRETGVDDPPKLINKTSEAIRTQ